MSVCVPVHRTFSNECGSGTFHTLGDLPKRKTDGLTRKLPVFHLAHDDDDDDHSSSLDEHTPQPLSIPAATVPFPRSISPPSSKSSSSASLSSPTSSHAPLQRGVSAPVLLSNGKPLKSSLKSSFSLPTMVEPPQAHHTHLRARSAPSSPIVTPKNVHFPEKDYGLATVRVFSRSARPAALSNPANGNGDDETETEGEETPPVRFPFPPISSAISYEIDPTTSSVVPSEFCPSANLLLESLNLPRPSSSSLAARPLLTGSLLVRNLAFEKQVAIRFTLDDWQTVSEVGAHYIESLSDLPSQIHPASSSSTSGHMRHHQGKGWDRFTFTIRLEDYAHSLGTRTLWLAVRYRVNSTYPEPGSAHHAPGGEWWDNNGGKNYRVKFRPAIFLPSSPRGRPRRETVSAPISSPRAQPPPATTFKEHALGLMIPSVPNPKEVPPMSKSDRRSIPLRTGKLNLCNYVPPTARATPSVSFPSKETPSLTINPDLPSPATTRSSSDDETASPTSSTLSTPPLSPRTVPRVIISGQPATFTQPQCPSQKDEDAVSFSRPGHITDWEWSASSKSPIADPPRESNNVAPITEVPELRTPSGRKALAESNSLYEAFVTQWCFAQGPAPSHHDYDHDRIMA